VEEASYNPKKVKRADMLIDLNAGYLVFLEHRSRSELVAA
jgi:hypothetical protein